MAKEDDFGFSFGDAPIEDNSLALAQEQIETLTQLVETQKKANRDMFRKIAVLHTNLKKQPEKPMINWPNRVEAIEKFITELSEYKI